MNAELRPIRTKAELGLADVFAAACQDLPGGAEVRNLRSAAFGRFAANGLPHSRIEAWKYTDLRRFMQEAKPLAGLPDAAARERARNAGGLLAGSGFRRLVIVDGFFVPELSDLSDLEPGLTVRSMAEALMSEHAPLSHGLGASVPLDDPALGLNTAFASGGVIIGIGPNAIVERPLHLVFAATSTTASAMVTRSLLTIGAGARVTVVESHEGPDGVDYQINSVLQMVIGDGAEVDHIKITREGNAALHVATLLANIGARVTLRDTGFVIGGAMVRNQLFVRLAGEGTSASISGASLLAGRQHADTTLVIDHVASGSQSREVFKSVVDEEARAVFQGRITVQPKAQKTDAKMMSRGLLLSDDAEIDCKPELEIFADDVQCGHGSTAGRLDDQLKFYLMARGIPARQAEALLIQAFVGEVVDAVTQDFVRDALLDATISWLGERR
ncbi:MAG TPA: Fe-S cluster assembly protein SufD [Bradyrhizobium sp.]|nr:Fe-S cluster assembly protein SufD [Bradyrhizobium sp.]